MMASSPLMAVAKITLATSGFKDEPDPGDVGRSLISRSQSSSPSLYPVVLQPNCKDSPPPQRKWLVNSKSCDIDGGHEAGSDLKFSLSASYSHSHSVSEPSSPVQVRT